MALDRVELKVCGLARVADMRGAEAAGVDYCGFIVEIERSPRSIPRETAALLARGCRARPVLVVEDMGKGLLTPELLKDLIEQAMAQAMERPDELKHHPAFYPYYGVAEPGYDQHKVQPLISRITSVLSERPFASSASMTLPTLLSKARIMAA